MGTSPPQRRVVVVLLVEIGTENGKCAAFLLARDDARASPCSIVKAEAHAARYDSRGSAKAQQHRRGWAIVDEEEEEEEEEEEREAE